MSAEWPELFASLGNKKIEFTLNDRHEMSNVCDGQHQGSDFFVALATELDQVKSKHTLVRSKHMYLNSFFKWERVGERLNGILHPFYNLGDAALNVVYSPDVNFFAGWSRYCLRHLRHMLVDILTFPSLVLLLIYDFSINKFYGNLIKDEEWSGDNFILGVANFISDLLAAAIILPCELLRHACSLVISLLALVPGALIFYPIGYALSAWFNDELPSAFSSYCPEQKNLLMSEIYDEQLEIMRDVLGVIKQDDVLSEIDQMLETSTLKTKVDLLSLFKTGVSEKGVVEYLTSRESHDSAWQEERNALVVNLFDRARQDCSIKEKFKSLMFEWQDNSLIVAGGGGLFS
ncbi:MAG: hypothetical protein P8L77_00480 [Gammaproteobacteria bacterium]|nr:hypothetical protein [Gammaproteobacteria bacterium]